MAGHGFTLSGVGPPGVEDPLGIWDVVQDDVVSFGAGVSGTADSAPPAEPVWRIELPESPAESQAILAGRIRASKLVHQDLVRVDRDLTHLGRTGAVSFSASDPLLAQKTELLATVDAFQSPVSYSLFRREDKEKESEDQESQQQWLAFVEQVRQTVANYARIETALAGLDVGKTTVGWTGHFATTWGPAATIEMMHVHRQSVRLALDSRIALIRIVSIVAAGAAGLALKAAIPGGQVLLLPAVWRFVRDVQAELRRSWPKLKYLR
jgi:hypothetical protein